MAIAVSLQPELLPRVLHDMAWSDYENILEEIGGRSLRVTYSRGTVEIMSPLPEHEAVKKAIARLLEAMADQLDLPLHSFGSSTFRRGDKQAGLEPDECYYLKNENQVIGMKRFDPAIHPAPDLAIEVDIFGRSVAREPVYASLGVGELWRFGDGKLTVRILKADGRYATAARSPSFAFLPMEAFESFVQRMRVEPQTKVVRAFRAWVEQLPR